MVCPVAAVETDALKDTVCPGIGFDGEKLNPALGGVPAATTICLVMEVWKPRSLVTVSVTLYGPGDENECVVVRDEEVPPSPNVQAYELIALFDARHVPAESALPPQL